jgi:hypothetical protein
MTVSQYRVWGLNYLGGNTGGGCESRVWGLIRILYFKLGVRLNVKSYDVDRSRGTGPFTVVITIPIPKFPNLVLSVRLKCVLLKRYSTISNIIRARLMGHERTLN